MCPGPEILPWGVSGTGAPCAGVRWDNTVVPAAGNLTRRQIAIEWIREGCPLPKLHSEGRRRRYRMWSPPPTGSLYPPPRIRGMGTVH